MGEAGEGQGPGKKSCLHVVSEFLVGRGMQDSDLGGVGGGQQGTPLLENRPTAHNAPGPGEPSAAGHRLVRGGHP